jgi:regulator of replication initiation timing
VLQYAIIQERHNYPTVDDDDCDYDCNDSHVLLTTRLNSLKANLRTTVNANRTPDIERKSMRRCLCNQTKNSQRKQQTIRPSITPKDISYYKKQLLVHTKHILYVSILVIFPPI